jgi:hypothetical protein
MHQMARTTTCPVEVVALRHGEGHELPVERDRRALERGDAVEVELHRARRTGRGLAAAGAELGAEQAARSERGEDDDEGRLHADSGGGDAAKRPRRRAC